MKEQKKLMITMELGKISAEFIDEGPGHFKSTHIGSLELAPGVIDNYMRPAQIDAFVRAILLPIFDDFSRHFEFEAQAEPTETFGVTTEEADPDVGKKIE